MNSISETPDDQSADGSNTGAGDAADDIGSDDPTLAAADAPAAPATASPIAPLASRGANIGH